MNTNRSTSIIRRSVTMLALLLTLTLSITVSPAAAQPSAPDDEVGLVIEAMEQNLTNPDIRLRMTREQWDAYGDNLEKALAIDHDGVQQGALRMLILYADNMTISRAGVHDIVRLYRDHPDDRMRRLAVVALGKVQDSWGLDFLKRSARYEEVPGIRRTILAVLAESGTLDPGPARSGS